MAKENRLGIPRGGRGWMGILGVLWMQTVIFGIGWAIEPYCTAQGNACDWVTLLYIQQNLKHCKSTNFNKN